LIPIEQLICTDPELAADDVELADAYAKAKAAVADQQAFKQYATQAWQNREKDCHDRQCLLDWYEAQEGSYNRMAESGSVYGQRQNNHSVVVGHQVSNRTGYRIQFT